MLAMAARAQAVSILCCWLALALGGCNAPLSNRQMIQPGEGATVRLKSGIWSVEPVCPPDAKPGIPTCGVALEELLVTADEVRMVAPTNTPKDWLPKFDKIKGTYLIAQGDPALVQIEVDAPPASDSKGGPGFGFIALETTQADAQGSIVAALAWPVLCGPPPEPGDWNYGMLDDEGSATNHPLDGMKMDDTSCEPRDAAALRAAMKPSRRWAPQVILRYVRDQT